MELTTLDLSNSSGNVSMFSLTSFTRKSVFYLCYYGLCVETEMETFRAMSCYLGPVLCTIGISANIMCICILRRSGLKKTSNIFLFALVVADIMVQVSCISYDSILVYQASNMKHSELCGWQLNYSVDNLRYVSTIVLHVVGGFGSYVGTCITILITVELILEVYFPSTLKKNVTPKTALVAVVSVYASWLPWVLTYSTLYMFDRFEIVNGDELTFVELHLNSKYNFQIFNILNHTVFQIVSSWIPVTLIFLGCTFIAVKFFFTVRHRKKLFSENAEIQWCPRTTKTLLVTCIIFSLKNLTQTFLNILILSVYNTKVQYMIVYELNWLVSILGTSSNLLVYVTCNRKLMKIFIDFINFR